MRYVLCVTLPVRLKYSDSPAGHFYEDNVDVAPHSHDSAKAQQNLEIETTVTTYYGGT